MSALLKKIFYETLDDENARGIGKTRLPDFLGLLLRAVSFSSLLFLLDDIVALKKKTSINVEVIAHSHAFLENFL